MSVDNHINKAFYVASAHPATDNVAGFAALTWIEVEGLQILPQLGRTHAINHISDLKAGEKIPNKGAAQGQDSTATFYTVAGDAGQTALKTICDDADGIMSIRIVQLSGPDAAPGTGDAVEYAKGVGHSFLPNQGDDSNEDGFTVGFAQHGPTVTGALA